MQPWVFLLDKRWISQKEKEKKRLKKNWRKDSVQNQNKPEGTSTRSEQDTSKPAQDKVLGIKLGK